MLLGLDENKIKGPTEDTDSNSGSVSPTGSMETDPATTPKMTLTTSAPNMTNAAMLERNFAMITLGQGFRTPPRASRRKELNIHRCMSLSGVDPEDFLKVTLSDFEKLKVLGVGSFGKVFLVKKIGVETVYAMKVIKKSTLTPRMKTRVKMERNVMALHRHPFIVKLHYAFQQNDRLFFVMDYCSGGDLYYHLHPSRNSRKSVAGMAKFVAAQLTLALGHLHEQGIIYRDLKPENVLFDNKGYIKLADFGLTKGGVFEPLRGARSICGSLHYMAPEVLFLQEKGEGAEYGTCADWWALGVLVYEMFWGLPPWYTDDQDELVRLVKTARLQIPSQLPPPTKAFIREMLSKDPSKRLGFHGSAEVKQHQYFSRVEFDRLLKREYAPSFVPQLEESPIAANNFDEAFTRMPLETRSSRDRNQSHHAHGHERDRQHTDFDDFDYAIDLEGPLDQLEEVEDEEECNDELAPRS